jgi:fibronectin-binding autotransporter adhesin
VRPFQDFAVGVSGQELMEAIMRLPLNSVRSALLLIAVGMLAAPALAQTSTWNGGSGDWSAAGNWTGGVPGSSSNVVIGGSTDPFGSPTLDVTATVNTLDLGMQSSLTFGLFSSLTVNSTATLVGNTNVDLSTLTLNGASTNFGTINLSTETVNFNGRQIILGEGFLNGTGTLGNAGTIQGAGNISVAINNNGIINATDSNNPLILSGTVINANTIEGTGGTIALNGGTVIGGILEGSFSSNGGTISFAQLGAPQTISSPGGQFFLTAGSTLSIQNVAENIGGVTLGSGATINGGGTATLITNQTSGALPVSGNGATLAAMNVNNTNGTLLGEGAGGLTLNGVAVTGGVVNGQFTTLNGTSLNNVQLGNPGTGSFSLADGSTLIIQGSVTTDATVTLGNATLNGNGTGTLTNFGTTTGNGSTLTNLTFNNSGTLTGTGAGITLNGVLVNGAGTNDGILSGLFTPINGTVIANSQLGSTGNSFSVPDGSTVTLQGLTMIGNSLSLGNGTTLDGGGITLMRNTSQSLITENGATLMGMNIMNEGAGMLIGTGAGLTLNAVEVTGGFLTGQITTLNGTTVTNATLESLNLTSGSTLTLEGTITQQGQFTNAGTVLLDKGATLNNVLTTPYVQTAGQTIVDGTIAGGSPLQLQGGVLSGTGVVNSGLDNVAGIVEPGDGGTPGTLFTAAYEQGSGATFDELIGASGNGLLEAGNSNITLDPGALLNIDLLNGFAPTDGETFDIMLGLQISGTFANAPTTGFQMDGYDWTIAYDTHDIVLDAVSPVNSGGGGGTNVPEPSSLPMLAIGITALIGCAGWKRALSRQNNSEEQAFRA